ncbi:hypothetical protein [Emticicia agri]|uniref:Alpha/beta hydrolase n=1 Tax=Emticicia agri TaxID=2492393 RepID=A0A4Q5LW56_9BACT|nr:hypothetical protein [Emticicia agri]RYU93723.1 hypothetical protein EWM59_20610 [Emticicia agri]
MEIKEPFVFQADAEIVKRAYNNCNNYIIEYDLSLPKEYCIIYCSSNDLYYPNDETSFNDSIVKKNRFEWYRSRIKYGYKHIFLRDIKKQWYINGVNNILNTPQKLIEFIKQECKGFKIITVGSSAGGFIAVLIGQILDAERIYTFNGQFEIISQLNKKQVRTKDPILYRNKLNNEVLPFYDTCNFIVKPEKIYYFYSNKSKWDIAQNNHIYNININRISFKTSNHGIPFLKSNLLPVLNLSLSELNKLSGKTIHPIAFSLKISGLRETIYGLKPVIIFILKKIYIYILQIVKRLINNEHQP